MNENQSVINQNQQPVSRFLRACQRLPVDATPVWFMRQAGRYMEEYRKIRAKHSFLEVASQPELAAEVTLQPVNAFDVDAAILFADILLPIQPMGLELEFVSGKGPVIGNPIRSDRDVRDLQPLETEKDLGFVLETIRLVRGELTGREIPLIGFSGAPFTLASYMIEGGSSRNYLHAKKMIYHAPETWHRLMSLVSEALIDYLEAQVRAGAQAVQMFDSWIGTLSPADYREYVFPYSRKVLRTLEKTGVPVIHFGTGTASLLDLMREAGGTVIGLDWRVPLDQGWKQVGYDRAVQGNLEPAALLAPPPVLKKKVQEVIDQAGGRPGHIFNLGHGIHKETDPANVRRAVDWVHELSSRGQDG